MSGIASNGIDQVAAGFSGTQNQGLDGWNWRFSNDALADEEFKMIMNRIAGALREQQWSTVFIELLVLIVGIFLGLQVDAWNEQRKDRADETVYLQRMHSDIALAEQLSGRVRERRIQSNAINHEVADVLFGRVAADELTDVQCGALHSANFFNIQVVDLPSVLELISTGRLEIIRNAELRTSLLQLQQTSASLQSLISTQSTSVGEGHLPTLFPQHIQLESYFSAQENEVRLRPTCKLAGMRQDQLFLNQVSLSFDRYDVYVRDGLLPWVQRLDTVHALVDEELGIVHR